jgi:two-component system, OmpR family, response regulator
MQRLDYSERQIHTGGEVDDKRIYALTSRGQAELSDAGTALSAPELKLLVLVDGRASVAKIARRAALDPQAVAEAFDKLARSGHISTTAEVNYGAIDPGGLVSPDESVSGLAALKAQGYFVRIARRGAARGKPAGGRKLAVLVIEDDAQLAKLLQTYLQMEDFAVRIASCQDQIDVVLGEPPTPDLVLLDVVLPDVDGLDLLARMRASEQMKSVPIIMATGKATREAVLAGLQRGADGYVTKPYDMEVLLKAVKTVLGQKK